jgi:hypothetical protein
VGDPAEFYESPEGLSFLHLALAGYTSTLHVFPVETKPLFGRLGILPSERLVYVKLAGNDLAERDRIDLTATIPNVYDTSILSVAVAIAMGCDPIVLLGLDYDFLNHRGMIRHFYDDEAVPWEAGFLSDRTYLEVMKASVHCWEAHAALRQIAARSGQNILNATEGSFLDVYGRVSLGNILAAS